MNSRRDSRQCLEPYTTPFVLETMTLIQAESLLHARLLVLHLTSFDRTLYTLRDSVTQKQDSKTSTTQCSHLKHNPHCLALASQTRSALCSIHTPNTLTPLLATPPILHSPLHFLTFPFLFTHPSHGAGTLTPPPLLLLHAAQNHFAGKEDRAAGAFGGAAAGYLGLLFGCRGGGGGGLEPVLVSGLGSGSVLPSVLPLPLPLPLPLAASSAFLAFFSTGS